jgi:enoyl-CoA hydratase/carnithine racemase
LTATGVRQGGVLALRLDGPGSLADVHRLLHAATADGAVVLATVRGTCDAASVALLDGCDIVLSADDARFELPGESPLDGREAELRGLVTLAYPDSDLDRETEALLAELAAKDPDALRLTKETLRRVVALEWDDVLAFNAAKVAELQALRAGRPSPQALAVQSFLAGKSKPGLGT